MDKTSYTNLAKAWEFVEDHAYARQHETLAGIRVQAEEAGLNQGSAAQAEFLRMLAVMTRSASVITVGSGSVVEILQLLDALDGSGQLTAVDSSSQGIAFIRRMFLALADAMQTTLRAVNAPVSVFLPRLNGADYDLIVVSGDAANYADTFAQAPRLLKPHGVIVFCDMLAFDDEAANGGVLNPADRSEKATAMRQLLDTVEADDRFDSALTAIGTGMLVAVKR
ncbi:O-methyltransferase [Bifidobacterium leontopitheci]|uniref:Methyltransferase n=1 Tax=Bifidobacterium leontopitheci TaxID=2650774 RepID=A0A6I1GHD3_9BIFI|nr:methyltransferase [Bifidobacterium leontopitheci]KAB7790112.1 methyltransferase [Bifidobacterium leontopitheci]